MKEPSRDEFETDEEFEDAHDRYEEAVEDRVNEEIEKRSGTNLITERTEKILVEVNRDLKMELEK